MPNLDRYRSMFDFTDQTVLVIGGGSGIGNSCALALAAHGATVVCADLSLEAAEQTTQQIIDDGGRARPAKVDVSNADSMQAVFESIEKLDGFLHTPAMNVRKRLLDLSEDEFSRVTSLNLFGTFNAITMAGRKMAASGGGSIVAVSSIRSEIVEPGQGVYAATKAGVVQLVKTLAVELGEQSVRVNTIAPGVVETPLTVQIKSQEDWYNAYATRSALGRWASPDEMAGAAVFLLSGGASFVTGSQLVVDGGWLAVDGRFNPPI